MGTRAGNGGWSRVGHAVGGSQGGSKLTHMESPELLPASSCEGVAVIRPAHGKGERLLDEIGWGLLGGARPGTPSLSLGAGRGPISLDLEPVCLYQSCPAHRHRVPGACHRCGFPRSPSQVSGVCRVWSSVPLPPCLHGEEGRPRVPRRLFGIPRRCPRPATSLLHFPACDWVLHSFLTAPLACRGAGAQGFRGKQRKSGGAGAGTAA